MDSMNYDNLLIKVFIGILSMSNPPTQKPRILYVDDDLLNLQLVRRTLSRLGFEIIEAMDGKTGIEMAHEKQPDLILMDLNMPDMDGFETVCQLRAEPSLMDTPIIMLTAAHTSTNQHTSKDVGCDDFLQKPLRYGRLVEVIHTYLGAVPQKHKHPDAH